MFINANLLIKGTIKNNNPIRARRSTIVDIPVSLIYAEIFNAVKSLIGTRQADYKISLAAKFNFPLIGDKVWKLEHEGVFPVLQLPKITMPTVKFEKLDFTKADLLFTLNVENPNDFDLPSPKMAYDYLVDKQPFVKSTIVGGAVLAAAAVTPVIISLSVDYADLFKNFQSLRNQSEAPSLFSLKGDFGLPAYAGESFQTETPVTLPLFKMPSLSFKGITLKNLGLLNIDFELNWEVENNNNFALLVKDLGFNFAVNNSTWANGKVPNAPYIAPGRKTAIPLGFSINNLNMVREITSIITLGNNVPYSCSGNLNLGAALPGLSDFNIPYNFSGTTKISK